MKKLLSLLMLVTFVTVQANAASFNGLEAAFKEFSYSMATLDAQEDKEAYAQATKKMNEAVEQAIASGATTHELVDFAASKIADPNAKSSFEIAMAQINLQKIICQRVSKACY
jgi:aromatic ring-opening dioxygenase catalytic subunit (LigB family)